MMLVHPDARRAGIGTKLMEAALEALADEACVRLDATPFGEPLYRRFGFGAEYELARTTVIVPSGGLGAGPESVRPMGASDLAEVFLRDRQVFGADRSAVLASCYDRAPDLAWTAFRGDELAGYCFGRPGFLYRQIGPVVAEDPAVAQDLVARCLIGQTGEKLAMDVPRHVPEWFRWLESAGFVVERHFLRMRRGQTQCPGLPARQFAIAGPAFG
jgi:hypothetical protein